MNTELSAEAAEYGRQAARAFAAAGGDELIQRAEQAPEKRADLVAPVFGELGAWELDPRGDPDELEAATALCRAAGYWAVPYPVAERLARPGDGSGDALIVAPSLDRVASCSGAVAGVGLDWVAVTLDGQRTPPGGASAASGSSGSGRSSVADRIGVAGGVVVGDRVGVAGGVGVGDVALGLVLPCWTLLGMLDRAVDLTRSHLLVREQFGRPLAQQQGLQFQLTEAEVERSGAEVLACYALWSVQAGRAEAIEDALALRMAALEAAVAVFRIAHQLHGAIGFCDETPLSWLSRASRPLRQWPLGLSATRAELTRRAGRRGLTGLFG